MSPLLIVVLVVAGLIAGAYLFGLSPEPARGRRPTPHILRRRSKWLKLLPFIPLLGAVGCLVLAFTGFGFSFQETSPTIVLVMDVSKSMNATDVVPNRLAAAETAVNAFLEQLPQDFRVGLVTFAGEATLRVAPTKDRDEVIRALASLTTSEGTVIGDGLTLALDAIEDQRGGGEATAAALLLSDGRDTGSRVAPGVAADRARSIAVPVFTVVEGSVDGSGEGGGANLEALQDIADTSGADTFMAQTASELTRVYSNLGSKLSVELDVKSFSTPLVIAAIALAFLAGFMVVLGPR